MTFRPTVPVRLTLIIPGVAIIAALVAYFHWTPPTIVAALAAFALIGWAAWGCTVRITVDDTTVSLVAPLWSREIPLDSIESVQVIPRRWPQPRVDQLDRHQVARRSAHQRWRHCGGSHRRACRNLHDRVPHARTGEVVCSAFLRLKRGKI